MPEIRANLSTELHRKLKVEAAHRGVPLKELINEILAEHVFEPDGAKKADEKK
jgi:hypothetical protein